MSNVLYPSLAFLNSLYNSLCSTLYAVSSTNQASVQSYVIYFLTNINSTNYINMVNAINFWLNSTTIPQLAVGIATGTQAKNAIKGLRIQVILSDGTTAFDSNSNSNNIYSNINIPSPDFITSGKFLINENHGTRTYFQGAILSQSGIYCIKSYSTSVNCDQLYLAIRQGLSSHEPFGAIIISINADLE